MNNTDLAWLAGIMEGEGTFAIYHQKRKTTKEGPNGQLRGCISLTNTDPFLIEKAYQVFKDIGVDFHIAEYKNKKGSTRPVFDMQTARQENVKLICEALMPYLFGEKKAKAQMLLRFVNKRIAKGKTRYDEDDWKQFTSFRSPTTTRETEIKDIV